MYITTYMLTENMDPSSWVCCCENGEMLLSSENKWTRAMSEASQWIVPGNWTFVFSLWRSISSPITASLLMCEMGLSLGNIVSFINSGRFVIIETSERRYKCTTWNFGRSAIRKIFERDKEAVARSQATIDLHEFSIGTEFRLSWSKPSSISDWYAAWTEKLKYKK